MLEIKLRCDRKCGSGRDRILETDAVGHKERGADVNCCSNETDSNIPLSILLNDSLSPPTLVRLLSVYQNIIEECMGSESISPSCVCVGGSKRRMLTQDPSQILNACVHLTFVSCCDENSNCYGSDDISNDSDDCTIAHTISQGIIYIL